MNTNIYAVKREKGSTTPLGVFFYEGSYDTREVNDLIDMRGWDILLQYDGWKTLALDGIGPTENEVFSEKKGHGDGVIITGKRMQERHIDMQVRQTTGANFVKRRDAISFHDPNYVYDLCFTWMGQTRWLCDCEIEGFKIETGKVNQNQMLTISYLCAESYYSINNEFALPQWESGAKAVKSIAVALDPNGLCDENFFVYPTFEATINADWSNRYTYLDFMFLNDTDAEHLKIFNINAGDKFRIERNEAWEYTDAYNLYHIRDGSVINTWPNYFSFSHESGKGKLKDGHTALFSVYASSSVSPVIDIDVAVSADTSETEYIVGYGMVTGYERSVDFQNEQYTTFNGPYTLNVTGIINLIETDIGYMLPFCVRFGTDEDNEIYEYFCEGDCPSISKGYQIIIENYLQPNRVGGRIIDPHGNEYRLYAYGSSDAAMSIDPFRVNAREHARVYAGGKNKILITGDDFSINKFDLTIVTGPNNVRGI